MRNYMVVHAIPRTQVEALDCDPVCEAFDVTRLSSAVLVRLYARVLFTFSGYERYSDELYDLPDVREFVRRWHARQPQWLFFGSLADDSLKTLYLTRLDSLAAVKVDGICRVSFNVAELAALLTADLRESHRLCLSLGFAPARCLRRVPALNTYFHFTRNSSGGNEGGAV